MNSTVRVYSKKHFTEDNITELLSKFNEKYLSSKLTVYFYYKESFRMVSLTDSAHSEEYLGYQTTQKYLSRGTNPIYFYEFLNLFLDQFISYETDGYIKLDNIKKVTKFTRKPAFLGFREHLALNYAKFKTDISPVIESHIRGAEGLSFSRNYPEVFQSLL